MAKRFEVRKVLSVLEEEILQPFSRYEDALDYLFDKATRLKDLEPDFELVVYNNQSERYEYRLRGKVPIATRRMAS